MSSKSENLLTQHQHPSISHRLARSLLRHKPPHASSCLGPRSIHCMQRPLDSGKRQALRMQRPLGSGGHLDSGERRALHMQCPLHSGDRLV